MQAGANRRSRIPPEPRAQRSFLPVSAAGLPAVTGARIVGYGMGGIAKAWLSSRLPGAEAFLFSSDSAQQRKGVWHEFVQGSLHEPELCGAGAGNGKILGGEPHLREERGGAQGRPHLHLLRRAPHRQRQAPHRPSADQVLQGPVPPVSHHEGGDGPPQGRLGYPRPACGAGGGEAPAHQRQGPDRGLRHRPLYREVQGERVEVQGHVGGFLQGRGLLGRHGAPLRHLRQLLYRERVVGPETNLGQGPAL